MAGWEKLTAAGPFRFPSIENIGPDIGDERCKRKSLTALRYTEQRQVQLQGGLSQTSIVSGSASRSVYIWILKITLCLPSSRQVFSRHQV